MNSSRVPDDTAEMIGLLERLMAGENDIAPGRLRGLRAFFASAAGREAVEDWLRTRWQAPVPDNYLGVDFRLLFRQMERKMERAQGRRRKVLPVLVRSAAVLAVPLLAGCIYLLASRQPVVVLSEQLPVTVREYSCPAGMRAKVMLPDSTQVWLNASSRLQLRDDFGYGTRTVVLSGEAFFEVSRREALPSIVSTPEVDIKVLGTSFNLSAYPDDEALEAVLVTGHIEVNRRQAAHRPAARIDLQPAQRMRWQKGAQTVEVQDNVNTALYSSWVDNRLLFEDTPMEEVVRRLERWFNVRMVLQDEALKNYTFTGSFDNRTLQQILSYIGQSSAVACRMDGDTVWLYMKE